MDAKTIGFALDLKEAALNLIASIKEIANKHPGLFDQNSLSLNYAVKRYECFWMPFRCGRTALVAAPMDVHLVWMAHMMDPTTYYNDCEAAIGRVLDHHLMSAKDLRSSRKVSRRFWANDLPHEPYGFEFVEIDPNQPLYKPLSKYDFRSGVDKLMELVALIDEVVYDLDDFLDAAIEGYKRLLISLKLQPSTQILIEPEIEIAVLAHKLHPVLFAQDCERILGGNIGQMEMPLAIENFSKFVLFLKNIHEAQDFDYI